MINIEQATKRLLIKSPFYGLVLLSVERRFSLPSDHCPTAYATVKGLNYEIVINEEYWNYLKDDDCRCNLLLHEIMHICLKHLEFWDRFPNKKQANIAKDYEVSNYVGFISDGGCYIWDRPEWEERAGARYYYDKLENEPKKDGDDQTNDTVDDHSVWDKIEKLPEATKELIRNQLNSIIKNTAEQVLKNRGTIPGEMQTIVDELFKQKPAIFNWKAYFRRMLGTIIDVDIKKTRKKESNRFPDASGLKHKRKSNIFLVIDTSGSVSDSELCDFFSEIHHIWKAGAKVTICECDSQIEKIYEYTGKWDGKISGRGGTMMEPAIMHFNNHRRDYQTIIFFTDGFIEDPVAKIMGQSIWIITSTGDQIRKYPGKTLFIPKNQ